MAEAECARIVAEAELRWQAAVALRHRLGPLAIGDVAVAVVAASAHRDEAFVACRHVIEELKRRVPIWKREYYADGTVSWVGGEAGKRVSGEAVRGASDEADQTGNALVSGASQDNP
jgi:molybdopterin synthase catalytic subunit